MLHRDAFSIPAAPLTLTLAGLIPFFGSVGAIALLPAGSGAHLAAQFVLLIYGAVILSFLGGVRWGVEITANVLSPPRWGVLIGSVLGSLAGWGLLIAAMLTAPTWWMFATMAGCLALHWIWDVAAARQAPNWYQGLRTIASTGAVLSLLGAMVLRLVLG